MINKWLSYLFAACALLSGFFAVMAIRRKGAGRVPILRWGKYRSEAKNARGVGKKKSH
jgi:hypothetical protein